MLTVIILSRQNITNLSTDKHNAQCGAYVVYSDENPDVVLLASGSEVSTLNEAATLLRNDGIRVHLVSVPSEGLKVIQSAHNKIVVGSTALPVQHRLIPGGQLDIPGDNEPLGQLNVADNFRLLLVAFTIYDICRKHGVRQSKNTY